MSLRWVDDDGEPGNLDRLRVRVYIPGPDLFYEDTLQGGNIQVKD